MLWTLPCTFCICCQWTTLILKYWYKRVENKFWLLEFSLILCVGGASGTWPPGSRSSWSWAGQDNVILDDIHLKVVSGMVIYLHYLEICLHLSPCPCTRIHPYQLVLLVGIHIHHHHGHWHCVVRQTSVDTGVGRRWGQNWSRSSGSPVRSGSRTLQCIVAKSYVECGNPANCFWPSWPWWGCPWWRCSCFSSAAWPSGSWTGWRGCWSSAPQG